MSINNTDVIKAFYDAFNRRDFATMQSFYHEGATFYDPVFEQLTSAQVKAMWEMLLKGAKDISVQVTDIKVDGDQGSCRWDAHYTFTQTGRHVHNIIHARFTFKDGKIFNHKDSFGFWRWSRQALGLPGLLMGWTPMLIHKVRSTAQGRLHKYMSEGLSKG